jgi:pyruvate/2-oxoglutarate dehydrogenase complex dihydrolipoamide acyltransferase (E2) component
VTAVVTVTITADHRVLDGARVARFLATLADTLNHL